MGNNTFNNYAKHIDTAIKEYSIKRSQKFFNPISYILSLKAKRVRSSLFLFSCDLLNLKDKALINGALAIEFFHNFTLIHDDIMDSAPLRRGNKTLHKKWSVNTAILAGDTLMVEAYIMLNKLLDDDTSLKEAQLRNQIIEKENQLLLEKEQFDILKKELQVIIDQKKEQ